jgi:hypothetical protein
MRCPAPARSPLAAATTAWASAIPASHDVPCHTDDLLDLKVAALAAHASQTRLLIELLGPSTYREWWRTESFRTADASMMVTTDRTP